MSNILANFLRDGCVLVSARNQAEMRETEALQNIQVGLDDDGVIATLTGLPSQFLLSENDRSTAKHAIKFVIQIIGVRFIGPKHFFHRSAGRVTASSSRNMFFRSSSSFPPTCRKSLPEISNFLFKYVATRCNQMQSDAIRCN